MCAIEDVHTREYNGKQFNTSKTIQSPSSVCLRHLVSPTVLNAAATHRRRYYDQSAMQRLMPSIHPVAVSIILLLSTLPIPYPML